MLYARKRNKFNAVRTAGGFPSRLEQSVYNMLHMRRMAGEISDIDRQVRVELTEAAIACKIDFAYTDCTTGERVYVEAKGAVTERWRIIRKLWSSYGPGKLEIWIGDYRRPRLEQTITPDCYVYAPECPPLSERPTDAQIDEAGAELLNKHCRLIKSRKGALK